METTIGSDLLSYFSSRTTGQLEIINNITVIHIISTALSKKNNQVTTNFVAALSEIR